MRGSLVEVMDWHHVMLARVCWFKSHASEGKCCDVMWITPIYSGVPHTILNSGLGGHSDTRPIFCSY